MVMFTPKIASFKRTINGSALLYRLTHFLHHWFFLDTAFNDDHAFVGAGF
ncbi:hypothetical protein HIMB100_00003680 [SAR116 cluster alpha proteobacterium HIMB100]|nr:hypothetical protein HIMB100_00003680 [SAR116 cluster alpha proteobacterium HIMB100]